MNSAAVILGLSAAVQLAAASVALSLIRLTGRKRAWLLIAAALALMAVRRLILLASTITGAMTVERAELGAESVGLVISCLLFGGVLLIRPYFSRARSSLEATRAAADLLSASERRYRFLVDRIPEAFLVLVDGRILFANRAIESVFGVGPEAALGRAFVDFLEPDSRPLLDSPAPRHGDAPSWRSSRLEVAIRDAGGKQRWIEIRRQRGDWEGREAEFVLAAEITARRRAQAAVEREERLFSRGPVVLFRWLPAPSRAVVYVSPNVEQWGFAPDALLTSGQSMYELVHPDDLERIVEDSRRYHKAGLPSWEQEYRLSCPDGRTRWVWDVTVVGRDDSGHLTHYDGYLMDVTDRKTAEAALRASEERFRLTVQATQDVLYDWDVGRDLLIWNPNTLPVLGWDECNFAPNLGGWAALIHPDDQARVTADLTRALEAGDMFLSEYRVRRRDGSWAHILDRGLIVRDSSGRALRMVGAMTDLSDRKRLEEQLRLAQRIEALGHLAGGVAHDFNNLLTAIIGSTELLQRRAGLADADRGELASIHHAAGRAAELTRGLLAFARRQILEPVDLDLNDLIRSELPLLRRLIPENIAIELRLDGKIGTVAADPGQIQQVLVNLCVNARDAMPSGGTIEIATRDVAIDSGYTATHPWAKPGQYVALDVRDTGIGMSEDTAERIFEPFFTTKEQGHGTGLGLATVYGIVKQHGGMIDVESSPGQGTVFRIHLPVVAREASATGSKDAGPVVGGRETILVVEDEGEVRRLLVEVLSGLGYTVLAASDGLEALELLARSPAGVDLVVTDVVMPRMGGHELYSRVSEMLPRTLFLFSSGYSEDIVANGVVPDRQAFFIAKPYGIDDLARKVRDVLDSREVG